MTGHDLRWGQDPGCTYKDKVVVVSVPHDGGWEDWWRGGMVGYTPGGTAPPLRLSPHRPPGVIHMNFVTTSVSGKTVSWGLKLLCYPLCLQGSDTEEKGVLVKCN